MAGVDGWDAIGPLKPTHKKLLNHVIPKVASKWHELGIELYKDADVPRLDIIQKQCPGDYTKACTEMLSYWLNTYTNATWNRLIKALRVPSLQLNAIALDIMRDVKDQTEYDDSGVPAVTGTTAVSGTPAVDVLFKKPKMWKLKKLVIPEVKACWKDLAYSMDYETIQIQAMERDGKDVSERCTKLFEDWLTTNHGCTPKTWQRLLERIEDVVKLYAAAGRIKQKLIENYGSPAVDKLIENRTKDDDSSVPTVTGTPAVTDTSAVDILSEDDDSGDTPAVEKLTDTPGVDKLSEAPAKSTKSSIPQSKGSSSTDVSSTSTNLWTYGICLTIVVGVAAVVIVFAPRALRYSRSS